MVKFRENKNKYKPTILMPIKNKINLPTNQEEQDDNSSNSESAFLTNLNIPDLRPLTLNDKILDNAKKTFLTVNEVEHEKSDQDDKDDKEAKMKKWHQFNIFKSSSQKNIKIRKLSTFKRKSQIMKDNQLKSSEVIKTL